MIPRSSGSLLPFSSFSGFLLKSITWSSGVSGGVSLSNISTSIFSSPSSSFSSFTSSFVLSLSHVCRGRCCLLYSGSWTSSAFMYSVRKKEKKVIEYLHRFCVCYQRDINTHRIHIFVEKLSIMCILQRHIHPQKARPLMVNDSSFSFDLTRKSRSISFCLSITVVIMLWENDLGVKCVGVHMSCHVRAVIQQDSRVSLFHLLKSFLSIAASSCWPQEHVKHLFLFSSSVFLRKTLLVWSNSSPLLYDSY